MSVEQKMRALVLYSSAVFNMRLTGITVLQCLCGYVCFDTDDWMT